ncbi:MAG: glycosyltransferase, partial [bacterium]
GSDVRQEPRQHPGIYHELFRKGEAFTYLSDDMCEELEQLGAPEDRLFHQPLGIKPERFNECEPSPRNEETVRVLTVARLVEKKGIDLSLQAIHTLLEKGYNLQYTIVGGGPRLDQLKKLTRDLGIQDEVNFKGPQSAEEVLESFGRADLFVLASHTTSSGDREGTPKVLLEAQASGLPVVTTKHAGIPEIVKSGDTGELVPQGDVHALVEHLERLIKDSELRMQMGESGQEFVREQFSVQSNINQLEELYRDLVHS